MPTQYGTIDQSFLDQLVELTSKERVSTSQALRDQHGTDESYHEAFAPDVVIFTHSTKEVASVVRLCAEKKIPIIPYGTGTSLEGHVAALHGGVCIDLSQMNEVIKARPQDLDVTVQAGVTRKALNEYLRDTGLFFPIDPGADASLGGMASTRASGTNAVRYGTMRENVLSLTVVNPKGEVIRTSSRSKKSAAGYDLTHLYVGSEGTLGIITEVTLRLYGIPEKVTAAVCPFPSLEEAVNMVITTIQCGIPVARIELLDDRQMYAVNQYSKLNYEVAPTLFFEFHGSPSAVDEQVEQVKSIAEDFGGENFQWASQQEERDRLWNARHNAYYAALALRPGCRGVSSDACVPISRLAEAILETKKDIEASFLEGTIVGHVGDGNYHTLFAFDPNDEKELAEAKRLNARIVERALVMEGTCTGEHGVGHGKMKYLEDEFGEAGLEIMRSIKRAMDPDNIMNPGKIVAL
ncbi:D-Lactate dehydrogenase, cytochrome c-dependent [Candidatus Terasakiella magnetica]|uniref:D-lactate dehydrogenase (cytochrome) n=1 Tax=Candidatus Terasakiella magnetica TaxID=1867952 RepID=A0A1C3RIE9_9PROT|nr:FAD-linked oxidase C-terminal domain-containing protein [Candidatus Terasakiella magnetica]SCA57057.1 D-Lactate dehydrogenase, cytochrome c-dependent [Candidatus Terasakiella magnetica]